MVNLDSAKKVIDKKVKEKKYKTIQNIIKKINTKKISFTKFKKPQKITRGVDTRPIVRGTQPINILKAHDSFFHR